ncbi:hypothetical protein ACIQAC_15255 [Streptomyces sp. NPDC088387]|uniref:hypothetical protein n=1 Tax=Streptomyces sp. NPDC088387 TaxID=3365859 RepID=UPI003827DC62
MDTLKKILALNADPAPQTNNPRQESMSHIHGVLNQRGVQELTVGHAVAAAIEGIRYGAGERGARDVHTVFTNPELTNAYLTPLNSPHAEAAHRQIAHAEFTYWQQQHARQPSEATRAAVSFDVENRVALQSQIGSLVQTGRSFTEYLSREENFTSGTGNPVAQYANRHLPTGSAQSPANQGAAGPAAHAPSPAPTPKGPRR